MKENIFPLKINSLRQDWWYLGITNLCQNIQNPVSSGLTTLTHILNGYEMSQ